MPTILHIETSTNVCSVALSKDKICIAKKVSTDESPSHSSLLSVFVQEMLDFAKGKNISIDAVAVSCGPGSYTGLRIGVSTAKGLCYGFGIPLLAINTLEIMASSVIGKQDFSAGTLFCPMIDARRMEVYAAFYNADLECVRPTAADIIDENSYAEYLESHPVIFFGNGAEKCKEILSAKLNVLFLDGVNPLAEDMIPLAEKAYVARQFEDVAYFEPFYLKDFVTTTPKNKGII